jgi:hypothetical protein
MPQNHALAKLMAAVGAVMALVDIATYQGIVPTSYFLGVTPTEFGVLSALTFALAVVTFASM